MVADAERWLPVVNWEGIYEVSDMGRVRRVRRGKGVRNVGAPMRGSIDRGGYPTADLHDRGRRQNAKIHRLVTDAFLGPLPDGLETRHLNGDPADARLSNLKYGTHAENMRDMVEHGRSRLANTHCPHGHPYDEANTWLDRRGARNCRICLTVRAVAWQRQQIAKQRAKGEDFCYAVREWGRANGFPVADKGRISNELLTAFRLRELRAA